MEIIGSRFPSSAKPYELTFDDREQYLYAYVKGDHDGFEISLGFWRELAAECTRLGQMKLLVEEDIKEPLALNEMYRLASTLPSLGFGNVCVAFVDRFADHKESNEFGELVATNRGFHVKLFDNFDQGVAWLLEQ